VDEGEGVWQMQEQGGGVGEKREKGGVRWRVGEVGG